MTKLNLKKQIKEYVDLGLSVLDSCTKVNNLYHNEYLFKVYEIQQEMEAA